jgi:tripartite-type tricarboxylate transporter receptor subunit TctC
MASKANILTRGCAVSVSLALTLLAAAPSIAQDYPSRPVRIISQAGVGSAPDVMARIVADQLGKAWGQQAIIINRPGASGANAAQMAASAEPDGYTLFLANSSTFTIMPETQTKLPFDVQRDFVPAGFVAEQPMLIAVSAALPVNSLAELIALAKEQPGQLLYAGNAGGSTPNMTGEFFRERAGIDITYVSYPGAAAGLTDVIAGRVQIIVEGLPALFGAVEARSIKPLAVLAARRLPNLPDVPIAGDTLPGFVATGWSALMARTGTPPEIVRKISADLNKGLDDPDVRARFAQIGAYVRPMSPDALASYIREQQSLWRPIARKLLTKDH